MTNYNEMWIKLTNTQLNKLKSAGKYKKGTILKLNKKNFEDEELPHEFFLKTGQTTKIRNVFANNMSTGIKFSKAQISKIIQSGGSFSSWLVNLEKKALTNVAILLATLTSTVIKKFDRKMSGKGAAREGKKDLLYLFQMKIWMILLKS